MSTPPGPPLKLLACGDVRGRFDALFRRLDAVHKKSGPFDLCLCVGSFFSADAADAANPADAHALDDVKSGRRLLPLPVYFLGPNSADQTPRYSDLAGYELAPNLVYLGRHGCLQTKEGVRVAYLSGGVETGGGGAAGAFDYEQVKAMEVQLKWREPEYAGVDVLITSEWPKGVSNGGSSPAGLPPQAGSNLISQLAVNARPRYHFAGLYGCHYERQPYRNHKVLNESTRHVTRFVGLGHVGNADKKKWLYAFNLVPMKSMERADLVAQPSDVTDVPYRMGDLGMLNKEDAPGQFFYDMTEPEEGKEGNRNKRKHGNDKQKGRDRRDGGQQQQKRPKQPAGPCWFCLSGAEVEKHLIVSIGEHCYLALPKGGLTPDHVMVLPIAHYASQLELPEDVRDEMDKFRKALRKMCKKQGKAVVFFERNYRSHHLQLQAVPLPSSQAASVRQSFLDLAASQSLELSDVPETSSLVQLAEPGTPYFYLECPATKERLFHRVRSGFPIQFGREALAAPDLLDMADRVDWRRCQADKDDEARMAKEFRKAFQPFDFTLEEDDE